VRRRPLATELPRAPLEAFVDARRGAARLSLLPIWIVSKPRAFVILPHLWSRKGRDGFDACRVALRTAIARIAPDFNSAL
jgi:hypothetical protein